MHGSFRPWCRPLSNDLDAGPICSPARYHTQQAVAQAVPSKFNGSEVLAMQVLNTLLAAGWGVENVRAAKSILLKGPDHNAD